MMTRPSSRTKVASTGHTSTQGACWQCRQGRAEEEPPAVGRLVRQHDVPVLVGSHIVGGRAGALAVLAADAALQVDGHAPVMLAPGMPVRRLSGHLTLF